MKKVLISVTALCLALGIFAVAVGEGIGTDPRIAYYETVLGLMSENGIAYWDWEGNVEAKLQWVRAMAPVAGGEDAVMIDKLLNHPEGDDTLEQLIDDFLAKHYGFEGNSDLIASYHIIEEVWGVRTDWSFAQNAQESEWFMRYFPTTMWDIMLYSIPDENAVPPEEALQVAWEAFNDVKNLSVWPDSWDRDDEYIAKIEYGVHKTDVASYPPYYTVNFGTPTANPEPGHSYAPRLSCYISREGQVMDRSYHRSTGSPAEGLDAELPPPFEAVPFMRFSEWSLEEKAEFSDAWRPMMEEYMEEHPLYRGMYYYETLHAYGLPDQDSISQESAGRIAREAALALGAAEDYVARAGAHFFYDVTDEEKPLWKVFLSTLFSYDIAYQDSPGYFAVMDAHTGEVIDTYERTSERPLEDYR